MGLRTRQVFALVPIAQGSIGGSCQCHYEERLDSAQVKAKAKQLSTALVKTYAFKPGETGSLFGTNTIWYRLPCGRASGASPTYTTEEMTHALKIAQSCIPMTLPTSLKVTLKTAVKAGVPRSHIFLLKVNAEGYLSIQDLMEVGPQRLPTHRSGYHNTQRRILTSPKSISVPRPEHPAI
ncbi:uncharacterized protein Z520_03946 [Fonsecaea multimorphosa CBS 102226]|uniref:Uncharacterized protein n=1 Tax=Fonsecaea multimorphosa CBS 102226 TaxID=1442371 RepID=A0A0D2HEE5_9EURO|nr:uncharacterized protein Z520_03946 [Fonsecaea multimorphosa CBS 102226]KIY00261.1 hypothetical protein Z520_03946 [Fonsecaea multimorphosa CBS 102226]